MLETFIWAFFTVVLLLLMFVVYDFSEALALDILSKNPSTAQLTASLILLTLTVLTLVVRND